MHDAFTLSDALSPMKKKFNYTVDGNPYEFLEVLCGEVFHVTSSASYQNICNIKFILNNKNGTTFGLDNAGTSINSYSVAKGYVSFFDLRDKHHERDIKWIEENLLNKYSLFSVPHCKNNETLESMQHEMVFLILNPVNYEKIISYHDAKNSEEEVLATYQLIPHSECWVKDYVPVEWIKKVYTVQSERRTMHSQLTHGKSVEEIERINRGLSDLLIKAQCGN